MVGTRHARSAIAPGERKVFPDNFPDGLKPRLRLFLSVDLVGSTEYKQSRYTWRPEILSFYRNFDFVLQAQHQVFSDTHREPVAAPEFWKTNGDELLYACELQSLAHAHALMHVWLSALERYRTEFTEGQRHLDVKSTAWIGLFPLPNCEVFFARGRAQLEPDVARDPVLVQSELRDEWYAGGGGGAIIRDFAGPSIDTGFRLTAWSTPQRLTLSVDLAFLLTNSGTRGIGPLRLHLSGRQTLKGVVGDEPYPRLWVPVDGWSARHDRLEPATTDWETIRSYCEAIIEQNYSSITPVYLSGARHDDFDWVPPYIIKRILAQWEEEVRYRTEVTGVAPPVDATFKKQLA